jgi:phage FluMu protein Com
MFFSNKMPVKQVRGAALLRVECENCKNTTDHSLWWIVPGKNLRYMGMLVAGTKRYVYICPICKNIAKELSKEQAAALKVGV